jgi:signal transduction histidine kinase
MNSIIGMSELLLDSPLDDDQRDCAQLVLSSGEQLLAQIDDVLEYTSLEAGTLLARTSPFDLARAIRGPAERLEARARAKGLSLASTLDPRLPKIARGDGALLGRAIGRLIDNAIKFTESGTVSLRAELAGETRDSLEVLIAVADSGIGMSAELQRRLFQPFFQADGSSTRRHGGAGLGLAISQRLVSLLGGTFRVDSREHQGTTVWLSIPLGLVAADAPAPTIRA